MTGPGIDGARAQVALSGDRGGTPVVAVAGEIDLSNADQVRDQIDALIGEQPGALLLDLGALKFIDSSGIAVLVRLHNRIDAFEVRHPAPIVRRILEVSGLTETFGITD